MAGSRDVRAGRAYVELNAKDNMAAGLARAAAKLKAFNASMQATGRQMVAFSAVAAVPFAASAVAFAGFEQSMARVKALTNANEGDFKRLSDEAKRLGEETVFSASQAADAMGYFALAGYDVEKILAAIGPTLNLAAAGQLDMAQSADIVAKIMSGMGIAATNVGYAVDVLTKAMTTANTDLPMLGEAMKYVGPIAKTAGIAFEEVTAAIQLLSNAGIQGEMAGTTLRGTILSLTSPSEQAREQLKQLGVEVNDSAGNMRSLTAIIGDLEKATASMGSGERLDVLGRIFDARQAAGVAELVSQGAAKLNQFTQALQGAGGTAARIAAVQLDTLKGSAELLLSALEGVAIAVGEALVGPLRTLGTILTTVTNGLAGWAKENQSTVVAIVASIAAVGALGAGMVALAITIKTVGTVIGGVVAIFGVLKALTLAVVAALSLFMSPIGLIVAGIGVVVGVVMQLTGGFGALAQGAGAALAYIGKLASDIGADVKFAFDGILDALKAGEFQLAGEIAMAGLRLVFAKATADISKMWTTWVHVLAGALLVIKSHAMKVFGAIDAIQTKIIASALSMGAELLGQDKYAAAAQRVADRADPAKAWSAADEQLKAEIEALAKSRNAEVEGIDSEIARLQRDLSSLRERAKPERVTADEAQVPEFEMPELPRMEQLAQAVQAVEASATKLRAIGTFNIAAAEGVAGTANTVQRTIATATQATAQNTSSILAAIQNGTVAFA